MRPHIVAPALAIALAATLPSSAQPPDALWAKVDAVFGAPGKDLPGGVHRFGWPRRDLHVEIGTVPVQPALGLGSWGAFVKTRQGDQAMTMGDLVLLEPELTPVVSALQAGGIDITAIHNHLIGETPHVVYLHFSGHGDAAALPAALKQALARTATPPGAAGPPAKALPAAEQAVHPVH